MIPCILSGGSGTRLWPVSRQSHPKQFCDLFDESLIIKTVRRLRPLGEPWVVTTKEMKTLTDRLFRELSLPDNGLLYEPAAKNTAGAVALLCKRLIDKGMGNQVVGVFPADSFVADQNRFIKIVRTAEEAAKVQKKVVTLGITPTYPSTGYGYIELSRKPVDVGAASVNSAVGFREKPDFETAEQYLKEKRFLWNAGIFVFEVNLMAQLFERHLPELWAPMLQLKSDLSNLGEIYSNIPSISIDCGIMEKLHEIACIPCTDIGWSDVGTWDEVAKFGRQSGKIYEDSNASNFIHTHNKAKSYAFVGTKDLIVADTADALLVMKKGHSQDIKGLYEKLIATKNPSATQHNYEYRPWGYFEVLEDTERFKSKVIRVDPGQQLSYQSHKKRAEHWIITKGHPEVVLNDETLRPEPGMHVFIPMGAKHRMRNPTKEVVEFVEVQVGSYFGEDDIIRYEDDYSRS